MAIQLSITCRNAKLDAIESSQGASCSLRIYSGTQPANCAAVNSGTLLAHILLPANWMADAANGTKALAGSWADASADGAGSAGHFRVYNSQATMDGTTCFMQGTVAASGADLNVNNIIFAVGQAFSITGFTWTEGNA